MRDMHACRREPIICILSWMITRAMEVRAIDDHLVAPSVILTAASSSESSAALSSGPSVVPSIRTFSCFVIRSSAAPSSGSSTAPSSGTSAASSGSPAAPASGTLAAPSSDPSAASASGPSVAPSSGPLAVPALELQLFQH